MMKYWVAVLTMLSVAGCAGFGQKFFPQASTQQVLAKVVIQYATLKAIKSDPVRATAVSAIVDQALARLNADGVITAEQLESTLMSVLPQNLAIEDQLLASNLVLSAVQEIGARVPATQTGLPIGEISVVLGWVKDAAALVPALPTPTPSA